MADRENGRLRGFERELIGQDTVYDNMAEEDIVDEDQANVQVDVDETPHLPGVVDEDGFPGFRPYGDASKDFDDNDPSQGFPTTEEDDAQAKADAGEVDVEDDDSMEREEDEASVDVQGAPVSDLLKHAQKHSNEHKSIQQVAPYARINPPSAYTGLLGGRATVSPGMPPQQVVQWTGRDVESLPVSIAFAPVNLATILTTSPLVNNAAFCRIQFGTRDGLYQIDIDVGQGGMITIPASIVYVLVGLDTQAAAAFALQASISFYPVVRTSQINRSVLLTGILNTAVQAVRPAFASTLTVQCSDVTTQYMIQLVSAGIGATTTVVVQAGQNPPVLQLANTVTNVAITSQGPNASLFSLIWGLNL